MPAKAGIQKHLIFLDSGLRQLSPAGNGDLDYVANFRDWDRTLEHAGIQQRVGHLFQRWIDGVEPYDGRPAG